MYTEDDWIEDLIILEEQEYQDMLNKSVKSKRKTGLFTYGFIILLVLILAKCFSLI